MPLLATSGDRAADAVAVYTHMCWPTEPTRRDQYLLVKTLNRRLGNLSSDQLVHVPVSDLKLLLESESQKSLDIEAMSRAKHAYTAGMVLLSMYLMDRFSSQLPRTGTPGASLSKANHVVAEIGQAGIRFADGVLMPKADKTVEKRWADYRSVSHFWAADLFLGVQWSRAERRGLKRFPQFAAASNYFFEFGASFVLDNRGKKAPEVLVRPQDAVVVDPQAYPASLPAELQAGTGKDQLSDWFSTCDFRDVLRDYRSQDDRGKPK